MSGLELMDLDSTQLFETFANLGILKHPRDEDEEEAPWTKRYKGRQAMGQGTGPNPLAQLLPMMQQMCKVILAHDRDLQLSRSQDCLIFYVARDKQGALSHLLQSAQEWKNQNPKLSSLRTFLMRKLAELLQRTLENVLAKKQEDPAIKNLQDKGLMLADQSWPYLRWNHQAKQLVTDDTRPAAPMKTVKQWITALQEATEQDGAILRFHSLAPHSQASSLPWKLQISPRRMEVFHLLQKMAGSAIWHTIAVNVKVHNQTLSPAAMKIQEAMGSSHKGKGKGKSSKGYQAQ